VKPQGGATPTTAASADGEEGVAEQVPADLIGARAEVRRLRDELRRLQAACDRRVDQLRSELDDERVVRRQLCADVERLKKIVATKLRRF